MPVKVIGGVEYKYEDFETEYRLSRYDSTIKRRIEIIVPKGKDNEKKEAEKEIINMLSGIYIDQLLNSGERND